MKVYDYKKIGDQKELSIFGLPLLKITKRKTDEYRESFVDLFPESFEKEELCNIICQIPKEHDGVFLLRAGMGESYLFCYAYDQLVKKFNLKNPCIVCHRPQYESMIKMFIPDAQFYSIKINPAKCFHSICKKNIFYKGIRFIIVPSCLRELQNLLRLYEEKKTEVHYVEFIKKFMSLDEFEFRPPVISEHIKKDVLKKINNFNIKNSVFIINDANFIIKMPDEFWKELEVQLRKRGYDIFYNSASLSIRESFYLASQSKAIIGLRCGFSEILSLIPVPKHIIYTKCKYNDLTNMIDIFSLQKYPFLQEDSIFEYDAYETSWKKILQDILGRF